MKITLTIERQKPSKTYFPKDGVSINDLKKKSTLEMLNYMTDTVARCDYNDLWDIHARILALPGPSYEVAQLLVHAIFTLKVRRDG